MDLSTSKETSHLHHPGSWDYFLCSTGGEGFPGGSVDKESACSAGNLGLIPGLGRSPGEGNDCPLQYSGLEDSMDCIVHGVSKSRTRLSDFHFTGREGASQPSSW